MINYTLFFLLASSIVVCDDPGISDLISPPGYPDDPDAPKVYSNYLTIDEEGSRRIHYILVQSATNPQNKPLTLWMNGGPGCSSKLGFLQEIGPYYLDINADYKDGDNLIFNQHSWSNLSNLLFIDSPIGTGLSDTQNPNQQYNDHNTAEDNMKAITYFFVKKFPSYLERDFFIAGESYAGKFIPDLALKVHYYNQDATMKINLKGVLIGNGVIDFSDGSLEQSQIEYLLAHNFIDPTLEPYWYNSCLKDAESAGCAFFHRRTEEILSKTNPQNIYYPCFQSPQGQFLKQLSKFNKYSRKITDKLSSCENFNGLETYFEIHNTIFHSQKSNFKLCNQTILSKYQKTMSGCMYQLPRILEETNYRVYLFNGDFDDVVPFTDTIKNLQKLTFKQSGTAQSWISEQTNQNIGFKRIFKYKDKQIKFWTIKGAGHEAPKYKRETAYLLFQSFLGNLD